MGGTPVDVAGVPVETAGERGELLLLELEWRRADPVDNTATLFRALAGDEGFAADEYGRIRLIQAFTDYYALASGGVPTRRRNATFVGERVASTVDRAAYDALTLDLSPPKRGGESPENWGGAVDALAERATQCWEE